ncbi:MAG: hypothetical protein WD875_06030 [Pirellulales bacterium]
MRRILLYAVAVLAVGTLYWAYRASQFVPDRYEELLQADARRQATASTEMFNRAQRLIRTAKQPGKWREAFSAEQINGYLAVDLEKQFAEVLSDEIRDPRVHIGDKTITLYCRYKGAAGESVLSIEWEPFLAERDVLGLRLVDARAGSLPLPAGRVRKALSEATAAAELAVRWVDDADGLVALVAIPHTKQGRQVELTHLELADDEIRLAGEIHRK